MIGGFLKMVLSKSWFCIKSQLSIRIFLGAPLTVGILRQKARLGKQVLFFCKRADCLVTKLTSDSVLRKSFLGYPRLIRRNLNLERLSSNIFNKNLVLRLVGGTRWNVCTEMFQSACNTSKRRKMRRKSLAKKRTNTQRENNEKFIKNLSNYQLHIALAKCQRATIQNKY